MTACMLVMSITELGLSRALGIHPRPHEDPSTQIPLFSACLWWGSRGWGWGKCWHVQAHRQHRDGDPVTPGLWS